MSRLGPWLLNGSFALFIGLYVYAAAAYGLTRTAEVHYFQVAVAAIFPLWLAGHAMQLRLPRIPVWPCVIVVAILLFGWSVTVIGAIDDAIMDDKLPEWNGALSDWLRTYWISQDAPSSLKAMSLTSALLGTFLMAIDFWAEPRKGRILLWTIILTAMAMVLFFFLQKIIGRPFILYSEFPTATRRPEYVPLSFATYRYHGNAADFLNLSWPIAAAVAIFAAFRQWIAWPLWFLPAATILLATFLNVSKAGNVLSPIGLGILLLLLIPAAKSEFKRRKRRIRKSWIVAALIPLLIIAMAIPFALPWKRWKDFADDPDSPKSRWNAYREFLPMIPDAGAAGFGPGTFPVFVFSYLKDDPVLRHVGYTRAHEDYLQTLVEWGVVGTLLWTLLLVPAAGLLFSASRKSLPRLGREFPGYRISFFDHAKAVFESVPSPRDSCIAAGAFTSVALVALHASIDFPMQIASLQFYFLNIIALGWSYHVKVAVPPDHSAG